MRLEQVLHGVEVTRRSGPAGAEVRAVEFDLREVRRGALFVATRGGAVVTDAAGYPARYVGWTAHVIVFGHV